MFGFGALEILVLAAVLIAVVVVVVVVVLGSNRAAPLRPCRSCGEPVSDRVQFCPHCGASTTD